MPEDDVNTTGWRLTDSGEEPTLLMRDLRNMTGFDHVGCTAHDAVECIGSYREAVEQMLTYEQTGGDGWWKGWEMLKAVYNGER